MDTVQHPSKKRQPANQECGLCRGRGRVAFYGEEESAWQLGPCPACHPEAYLRQDGFLAWLFSLPTAAVVLTLWLTGLLLIAAGLYLLYYGFMTTIF